MKGAIRISLRAGEKIFVNGAVLRVDRKVSLEFLNDVTFLLENHVLQPEDTTTPLKQLYFAGQIMLMNPAVTDEARPVFKNMLSMLLATFENGEILKQLKIIDELVCRDRVFEALKVIRALYPLEESILRDEESEAGTVPDETPMKSEVTA
jgi:flagellar biosynthesis repressor protein FlbT